MRYGKHLCIWIPILDSHIGFVKQKQKTLIFDIHYYVTLNSASKYF